MYRLYVCSLCVSGREAEGEAAALPGPDAYQEYVAKEAARAGKRVTIVESDDDSETEEADVRKSSCSRLTAFLGVCKGSIHF